MESILDQINTDSRKHGIFLSICGPLSQDLMVEMGEILKRKMKVDGAEETVIKKVFAILVEINQNIIYYSTEKVKIENSDGNEGEMGCGIITIGYENDHYFLTSGNMIENHQIDGLKERLIKTNGMEKEELDQWYREKRKKGPKPGSRGADLGLIEVARKVSQPLEFDFEKIENDLSFFTLKTVI